MSLSDHQHRRIFDERIAPKVFALCKMSTRPVAVLMGGQPGSGKSGLLTPATDHATNSGDAPAVQIVGDDLRDTAGTAYQDVFGWDASPDCGHRYTTMSADERNGRYTVEATAHWDVTWSGAEAGALTEQMTSTIDLVIGEVQVLVTAG